MSLCTQTPFTYMTLFRDRHTYPGSEGNSPSLPSTNGHMKVPGLLTDCSMIFFANGYEYRMRTASVSDARACGLHSHASSVYIKQTFHFLRLLQKHGHYTNTHQHVYTPCTYMTLFRDRHTNPGSEGNSPSVAAGCALPKFLMRVPVVAFTQVLSVNLTDLSQGWG